MKFKEALYEVLDNVYPRPDDGSENKVSSDQVRAVALLWNMLVASKNVLDDYVYINNNNEIMSVPVQKSTPQREKPSKVKKTAPDNKPEEVIEEQDGAKGSEQ